MRHLAYRWRALWNPDMYHGWGRKKKYFEGWYYKMVDATGEHKLAVIPGVSMDEEGNRHAFIQVLDANKKASKYHTFEYQEFFPSQTEFNVRLADNRFSTNQLTLNLPNLKGSISFQNQVPWPSSWGAPGIMGWYSFVPFMECYHGVTSMQHTLEGTLEIDGQEIDFTDGKGYMEKDWGTSFPSAYIWMQTNHFNTSENASLFASVARIPWLGSHFVGYIAGFWIDGTLYRFSTYAGDKIKAQLGENTVFIGFKNSRYHLKIAAHRNEGATLSAPIKGKMTGKVNESLDATIDVELYERGKRIFSGSGSNAGLEVSGIIRDLLSDDWL
jgi:tocopherol cyclase